MSKVVFVGNVPYNMGEDQLIDVFKSVGQVIGFRLVFDRDTGKPKGYGFCEFSDHETAQSAVRNLNNVDVGGRPLRIDLADSDPFLEGKTTVRGELIDGGTPGPSEPRSQWRTGGGRPQDGDSFLSGLPTGVSIPKGSSSLDHISQTLASMQPSQLMEVLAQMKAFVYNHPEQARILLVKHPQLAYALFQALLLNKIVDSAILQRMLEATAGASAPAAPVVRPAMPLPPPHLHHQPTPHFPPHAPHMPPFPPPHLQQPQPVVGVPPQMSGPPPSAMFQHHQQAQQPQQLQQHAPPMPSYYRGPPPQVSTLPPPTSASTSTQQQSAPVPEISDSQRTMLMQVLSLTQDQINALPETERSAILQLRNQFMGGVNI